jgi:hypothetical protein
MGNCLNPFSTSRAVIVMGCCLLPVLDKGDIGIRDGASTSNRLIAAHLFVNHLI